MLRLPRIGLLGTVYVLVGIALAASKDYLDSVETVRALASALLAIALWPLLLLGIDLHVRT